jgi:CheY-like chemotaxis protein
MRILVLDEDSRDVPHICDEIAQSGHKVQQVTDWKDVQTVLHQFKPDALLIDLMIPAVGLPSNECGGGFTTGAYIYETMTHDSAPGIPFAVFSSAFLETTLIKDALKRMEKFPEYRGVLSKECNPDEVIALLRQIK